MNKLNKQVIETKGEGQGLTGLKSQRSYSSAATR